MNKMKLYKYAMVTILILLLIVTGVPLVIIQMRYNQAREMLEDNEENPPTQPVQIYSTVVEKFKSNNSYLKGIKIQKYGTNSTHSWQVVIVDIMVNEGNYSYSYDAETGVYHFQVDESGREMTLNASVEDGYKYENFIYYEYIGSIQTNQSSYKDPISALDGMVDEYYITYIDTPSPDKIDEQAYEKRKKLAEDIMAMNTIISIVLFLISGYILALLIYELKTKK